MEKTMEKIVALAKARGFVYPGSEIYGGLANTWDYGNLGVELKNNVKKAWWQKFITSKFTITWCSYVCNNDRVESIAFTSMSLQSDFCCHLNKCF